MHQSLRFVVSPGVALPPLLLYGVGAIGREVAREILRCGAAQILGAVDTHPEILGRRLSDVFGASFAHPQPERDRPARHGETAPNLLVTDRVPPAPAGAVAVHMAGSHLPQIEAQLADLLRQGYSVVSSAEELVWPTLRHPDIAARLDALAKEHGVAVVGAGVNPGFVMDVLPAVAASVCRDVERVEVSRIVNALTRREPLQRKIGSGLSPEEFERLAGEGRIGHVGLAESCAFVAAALRLRADRIEEDLSPVVADHDVATTFLRVRAGQVRGIRHSARSIDKDEARVVLRLVMALDEPAPCDEVRIEGRPPLHLRIEGGTPGDAATVAALLNAVPRVAAAPPGLHTLLTLPLRS